MAIDAYLWKGAPLGALLLCILAATSPAIAAATPAPPVSATETVPSGFALRQSLPLRGDVRGFSVPAMAFEPKAMAEALDLALDGSPYVFALRAPLAQPVQGGILRVPAGELSVVLDRLSQTLDFFWVAERGVIAVDGTREFVLSIPKALHGESSKIQAGIVATGATQVRLSPSMDAISFNSGPKAFEAVKQLVTSIGDRQSMPTLVITFGAQTAPVTQPAALPGSENPNPSSSGKPAAPPPGQSAASSTSSEQPSIPAPTSGRPGDSTALTDSQIASIAQERIKLMDTKQAPPASFWAIRQSDKSVEGLFKRWAQQSGWSIRYEFERIPVLRNSSVVATDFVDAVKQIQIQLVEAGYDVDLTSIGKTMRISTGGKW